MLTTIGYCSGCAVHWHWQPSDGPSLTEARCQNCIKQLVAGSASAPGWHQHGHPITIDALAVARPGRAKQRRRVGAGSTVGG